MNGPLIVHRIKHTVTEPWWQWTSHLATAVQDDEVYYTFRSEPYSCPFISYEELMTRRFRVKRSSQ